MSEGLDIKLFLSDNDTISALKTQIYEEELKVINDEYPLEENKLDINKTYIVKNLDNLEIGFFIRNGLNQKISLEDIQLVLQDKEGNNIIALDINFGERGIIPPISGKPFSLSFPLEELKDYSEDKEYSIKFGGMENIKVFKSVLAEIENMPDNITFEEEQSIRQFISGLGALKDNEVTISVFNLEHKNIDKIACIILIRNGSNKIGLLQELPISIISENGEIIAKGTFKSEEGIKVSPFKSKIINFEVDATEASIEKHDLSKCKAIYL
ncbi:SLAP domain-containing protein [Clostridium sp.]|uniref:SLAP domain-containing protein n=1 Tax=Clostridium sp. TaxID=1506 RepID=UPI002FCAB44D